MSAEETPMKLLADLASGESKMVPLDAAELAQREVDQAAAAAAEQAAVAKDDTRAALVAKLKTGKASPEEVQAALAELL